ncbi:hypothetical protein AAG906_038928 [Vitis piasezkii]
MEDKVVVHSPHRRSVNVERKKDDGSIGMHSCSDEMIGKGIVTGARDDGPCIDHNTCSPSQKSVELQSFKGVQMGVQEGCDSKQPSPTPRRRFKHIAKMLVKPPPFANPYFSQCVKLFPKISQQERLVADYALSEDGEPRSCAICMTHI